MEAIGEAKRQGFGRREKSRYGLKFLLALSFFMVIFSLYGAQASVFEKARRSVLDAFEPVLEVVGGPIRWAEGKVGNLQDYLRLASENERLKQENAELRYQIHEAMTLRRRLDYFETILDVNLPEPATYVDAQVIGQTPDALSHAVVLSAGTEDGVREGAAVIDADGLVGFVTVAGEDASRVLLVTNFNARTPVFVEGLGIDALMVGRAKSQPIVQFFSETPEDAVPAGSRIVTSGAGGLLPRGIPVGTVAGMRGGALIIDLYADLRTVDLVRVVDYAYPKVEPQGQEGTLGG
jgi:rod shape-determining protein MreC